MVLVKFVELSQQRVALITANLNYGDLSDAAVDIQEIINTTNTPTGTFARIAGQNEEMSNSFVLSFCSSTGSIFSLFGDGLSI